MKALIVFLGLFLTALPVSAAAPRQLSGIPIGLNGAPAELVGQTRLFFHTEPVLAHVDPALYARIQSGGEMLPAPKRFDAAPELIRAIFPARSVVSIAMPARNIALRIKGRPAVRTAHALQVTIGQEGLKPEFWARLYDGGLGADIADPLTVGYVGALVRTGSNLLPVPKGISRLKE